MEVEVPNMNGDVENGLTENIDRVEALDSNDNEQLTSISETEGRIYRKAKRRLKKSPSKEFTDGTNINGVFSVPSNQKNLRRSRTGNRGLPKKGMLSYWTVLG